MKRVIITILVIGCVALSFSQQDPQITHFHFLVPAYNPAYAGLRGDIEINLLSRRQWVKFDGAPQTNFLTVDAPVDLFSRRFGVGVKLLSDQYGFVTDNSLGLLVSKQIDLGYGYLSLGLSSSIFSKQFNPQWQFPDQQEDLFNTKDPSMVLDIDIGAIYGYENFIIGLSVTHVTAPKFVFISENGNSQQVGLVRHYYLTGSYTFSLPNNNFELIPSFLVKSEGSEVQFDVNLNFLYNKKIWAGVSYRNKESIIFLIGTSYIKDIKIGLSYDALINSIGRISTGSFEIFVGYNFAILKMEKPQHYHNVKTL